MINYARVNSEKAQDEDWQIMKSPHYGKSSHFLFFTDCKKKYGWGSVEVR